MKYASLFLAFFLLTGCFYKEPTYRIFYHGNGSTEGRDPQDVKSYSNGDIATILDKGTLRNEYYDFIGWRYYSTILFAGDKITIFNDDVNLYAIWDDGLNTPFSYRIEAGGVIITRYNEQFTTSVNIPNTLASRSVVAIDDNVFSNLSLVHVRLPARLNKIGVGAFTSNRISNVIIPDTVEYIGVGAFRHNSLTKVTLGNSLKTIEPYTFGNNSLKDIILPENITAIGTGAFFENEIDMIKIGDDVEIANDTALGTHGASFLVYYNNSGKKSGLYMYIGDDIWEQY